MSALSAAAATTPLPSTGLPTVDQATEPASVRAGGTAAKNAYETGLAFEQMLDNELTQTLTATISGTGSSDDGLGASTDPTGASADPAAGAASSMLPNALSTGLMTSGGTGIAMEIARSIDPGLASPSSAAR